MPRAVRLRIARSAALPTLVPALVILSALAIAGLVTWTVVPSVVVALAVHALITFVRLGRIPAGTMAITGGSGDTVGLGGRS
ncbi:hypothetical protein ACFC0M_13350 [Streptomyces sp. NPDC056149]|uniref:hypothetical protein n=1 Tax=unclassified Streptomyces TaxID=2593676 RepID=UPI00238188B3|nr:hypothetical protein [Streptomyces sp. WZ-12]